ncbi:MAG: hypothetical protein CL930_15465 [Deltaproteobacteria bacterium]|nr:hypothetical protein [Deltaproteobacteria bacterium]
MTASVPGNQKVVEPDHLQQLICMACVAGALIGWEVLLTRLASLRYHFHFGHLAVSNGLLGIGIAGTWLALRHDQWKEDPKRLLARLCEGFVLSLLLSWLVLFALPVHTGSMNATGIASFALFGLFSMIPFVFGGGIIGLLLSAWPTRVASLYGADLLAAGLVCLLIALGLPVVGIEGALSITVAMAAFGTACVGRRAWVALGILSVGLTPILGELIPAPSKVDRQIIHSEWTALSRVDLVDVPEAKRTIRARGVAVPPTEIPEQIEIMQDGSASTLLTNFSEHPEALDLLSGALYSGAVQLRPDAEMFIIGFGGGDDVWTAIHHGAKRIDAVDLNSPVLAAHQQHRPTWSKALLQDERVHLSVAEGRHALMRTERLYDVVQLTGIDTWAALTSGAYLLAENHLYTTDAFSQMLDRLKPGGILQITRMAAEMEALRVLVQLREALKEHTKTPFKETVAVIGSIDHQVATLTKPEGFGHEEVMALHSWAKNSGLIVHHLPGMNSTNLISSFIRTPKPETFINAFPRNISPTTDDSPYFFQFTRWTKPAVAATTIREPTYISQGNPLFLVGHLMWSVLVAACALFVPLLTRRRPSGSGRLSLYFSALGLGFILVELGLIQRLTLYLGHPMRSLTVTLAGLLIASGCGSLYSSKVKDIRWIPVVLATLLLGWNFSFDSITQMTLGSSLWLRVPIALAIVIPIGFILGIPFAWGLARCDRSAVPWAWATNAFFTVLGTLLTVIISMTLGFSAVLVTGATVYFAAIVYRPFTV